MIQTTPDVKKLRILLACARPMASRTLKLQVHFEPDQGGSAAEDVEALLRDELKLTVLGANRNGDEATFQISAPYPDLAYIDSEIGHIEGVLNMSPTMDSDMVNVLRADDEFNAVLNSISGMGKSVEVAVLDHVRPQQLRDELNSAPGYDVLYLVCHGAENGILLLEEGQGWTRYMGGRELAEPIGRKVKVLILGACHGERSLEGLLGAGKQDRPGNIVFTQGEHAIAVRAVQLFNAGFFRGLLEGLESDTAFNHGVERVRLDDRMGEVAWPDGMEDFVPSPFKRLKSSGAETVAFDSIQAGELVAKSLSVPPAPHRKIIRADEIMLGREAEIVILADQLLPPKAGLIEQKNRVVNLHGEGGIGKTRLAQSVCDLLEDYRLVPGGIFEIDCEPVPDAKQLAVSMLKAIGVTSAEQIPDPAETLAAALREISSSRGEVLLMLDNLDPLFDDGKGVETSRILKQLLTDCPGLRILTTCRRQLQLGGYESDFLVDPLDPRFRSIFLYSPFLTRTFVVKYNPCLRNHGITWLNWWQPLKGIPLAFSWSPTGWWPDTSP